MPITIAHSPTTFAAAMMCFIGGAVSFFLLGILVRDLFYDRQNRRALKEAQRLHEERSARLTVEAKDLEVELAANEALHDDLQLRAACCEFTVAALSYLGVESATFHSVDSCLALLPDLVHGRHLDADSALAIEQNVDQLTIAGGILRRKLDEIARSDYLDGKSTVRPHQTTA